MLKRSPSRKALARVARTASATIICCGLLASCGAYRGTWPKLGPTALDAQPVLESSDDVIAGGEDASSSSAGNEMDPAVPALAAIVRALQEARSAYAALDSQLVVQKKALSGGLEAAARPGSTSWSAAQIELSRLNQLTGQMDDVRSQAAGIAGDLAGLTARGQLVNEMLADAGKLINQIDASLSGAETLRQRARNRLAS